MLPSYELRAGAHAWQSWLPHSFFVSGPRGVSVHLYCVDRAFFFGIDRAFFFGIDRAFFFGTYIPKKGMDDESREHAAIADAAYKVYERGFQGAQKELDSYLKGYTIDPDLSDDHAVTVLRPDGSAIIGYRGTDPYNIFDIGADALIATGYHREKTNLLPYTRFQRASDHFQRVSKEHDVQSVTGHSLGGSLADFVGRRFNTRAFAFNPGESPFEYGRFGLVEPSKTKAFTTGDDPISISTHAYKNHQEVVTVPKTVEGGYYYLDSHSLKNFLPSKRKKEAFASPIVERRRREERLCRLYPELCPEGD